MMSILLRDKLKNGKLKTVYIGYIKCIYLMLDSYSFLSFWTILFNLIIFVILLFIAAHKALWAAEIVECVCICKYVDGISQNLQNLSQIVEPKKSISASQAILTNWYHWSNFIQSKR